MRTPKPKAPPKRWVVWRKTEGDCCYCGAALMADLGSLTPVRRFRMDLDHAVPRSRGGSNNVANLLPACPACNNRKNARTVEEFLARERARTGITNLAFHPAAMAFICETSP